MAEENTLNECVVCSKQENTNIDLEDHIVENHPTFATPEMQESYNIRHPGTAKSHEEAA